MALAAFPLGGVEKRSVRGAAEALGFNDPVIDFEVTPNRPDWLGVHGAAESFEARSDRFLAAVDLPTDEPLVPAYFVRAVSPGDFHYAAPLVEDLYRPGNRAIGETGRLTVLP